MNKPKKKKRLTEKRKGNNKEKKNREIKINKDERGKGIETMCKK